jgi:hypothetical protein
MLNCTLHVKDVSPNIFLKRGKGGHWKFLKRGRTFFVWKIQHLMDHDREAGFVGKKILGKLQSPVRDTPVPGFVSGDRENIRGNFF